MTNAALRAEALARVIACRLPALGLEELIVVDVLVTQLMSGDGVGGVYENLQRDRYADYEEGRQPLDAAYCRGWNAGSRHAEAIVRVHRGLEEMKAKQACRKCGGGMLALGYRCTACGVTGTATGRSDADHQFDLSERDA